MERRMTPAGEIKVEKRADGGSMIVGYGAVFYRAGADGTEYRMWSDLVERIAPVAFNRAIAEKHDAAGLFNHDPSALLGRVSADTMRLSVDSKGLRYEIDLPDTTIAKDVAASIARRDIAGSSFSFSVTKQSWQEAKDGPSIRTIEDLDLYDTGPVTFPAYTATTTGLRSAENNEAIIARDQWRRQREAEAVSVRLRNLEVST